MLLKGGELGVSAVVGTVMLVAIGLLLAAGTFLMVQRLGPDEIERAPDVGFGVESANSQVSILKAPAGIAALDWFDDLRVTGSCTPLLNGNPFPTASGTPVAAGDVLSCAPGEDLRIASSDANGNALLFQHQFGG